ncbi:IPTL-CTERM sorting domain-containing protein [Comamonas odontotermitis]|uniref:IPTL-CTERM sorting domain-containing protein n=1 Tax=Comamonas odontotermitis TaxID=379895 RepID=UPI001CC3DC2A|nr:IPTL-CTERM sorting domain-containing protein [Comamonas odontotermitis]UBB15762.1 IPTL-CTERM sorting domain-containing protein [Comamonas odontotermitis]
MNWLNFSGELLVGNGSGTTGSLGVKVDPAQDRLNMSIYSALGGLEPLVRVGDQGGVGAVDIDLMVQPLNPQVYPRVFITSAGLGVGTEGTGVLTAKGAGIVSNPLTGDDPNLVGFLQVPRNGVVGRGQGGKGTLNLDGAGLAYAYSPANPSDTIDSVPSLAIGVSGGIGKVDILHGGKLGAADGSEADPTFSALTRGFIGKDGGIGVVTLHDPAAGARNIAHFSNGLAVGSAGGQGNLDVLGAGKVSVSHGAVSSACRNAAQAPASLQIGGSGVGLVKLSGVGADLFVNGNYVMDTSQSQSSQLDIHDYHIGKIQIGGNGKLVAGEQASVKVGTAQIWNFQGGYGGGIPLTYGTYGIGPVNVEGGGSVYYGSETSTPTAPGSIDASLIFLSDSVSGLYLNHTGNLSFNVPLKGMGQLVQQAGTTSMAQPSPLPAFPVNSGCAPAIEHPSDQLAFTGPVEVRGGTLVLPANDVLSNAQSFTVTGGTLMQGGTDQTLNQVTLSANGILQLTDNGQSTSDMSKASNWSGGGTVMLDTVLGACGSASDKLVITGAISGETRLKISNANGPGAATSGCDGILVVDASAASGAGTFVLDGGPIAQGGYQYQLVRAGNGNWYLKSTETPGTIVIQQTVTPPGGTPAFSGNIPFTLNCTTPSYQYSGNITVTNNTGTSSPITVAAGSQCSVVQGTAMPSVTGYKWEAPAYGPAGTPMPVGGSQTLTMHNNLIKVGSTGGNGGTNPDNVTPVPTLGAAGLGALVGLMVAAAGFMGRRREQA